MNTSSFTRPAAWAGASAISAIIIAQDCEAAGASAHATDDFLAVPAPPALAPPGCDAHPEHVLIRFRDNATPPVRAAAHVAAGAIQTLRAFHHVSGLELVRVKPGSVAAAIAAYRADPSVQYAEPDVLLYPTTTPNDPSYGALWGLHNSGQSGGVPDADIDAPEAWSTWTGASTFPIAVLDSGVAYTHPDLAANIWTNPGEVANGLDDDGNGYIDDLHGIDTINNDSNPMDDLGHGTHCAGTIGARGDNGVGVVGVNWQCRIAALKFFGPGSLCPLNGGLLSDCVEAMEYVIDKGIRVSSNSYGCYGAMPQALYDIVQASQSIGHIFVVAAGNSNANNDTVPQWPAGFDLPNVICVAATTSVDTLAAFSNYGASTVDLGAPGVGIYSTLPGGSYGYYSGTSMACPHVAGVVALVWSHSPGLSWQEVRSRVLDTARPIAALAGKTVTGGVVNAADAINVGCTPGDPSDMWIDFAYTGSECGTDANPFDSLAEAVVAVTAGGTISIKAGTTNETAANISKSLTIKAVGGTATIGQP